MSVRTKEEILAKANEIIGENNADSVLEFIGDLSDTLDSSNPNRIAELEAQVQQVDADWRKKYRERFFSPVSVDDEDEPTDNSKALKTKYEELFS